MIILSPRDFYQTNLASLIADYDKETLATLYQPLVGHVALSIFFTFWAQAKKQAITPLSSHEELFVSMQISTGEFIEARKKLEGVGLLRTYLKDGQGLNIYYYELYAPKTPNRFFADTLLFGLLIKYIGEKDANRLKQIFNVQENPIEGEDISATFQEVFSPDFEDETFIKAIINNEEFKDRKTAKIDSEFNYDRFIGKIKESSQIKESIFNKKVLKEIERLSTLYGIDENIAALRVIDCFDPHKPNGEKIDFKQLTKMFREDVKYPFLNQKKENQYQPNLNTGDSSLAKKINLMETISPKDYLQIMQNNTKPVNADLNLIDDISKNLHLPNPVINALIDFVLITQNNTFPRAYSEKIAASLARSNIKTTIDAMEFLNSVSSGATTYKKRIKKKTDTESEETLVEKDDGKQNKTNEKLQTIDIDWDAL